MKEETKKGINKGWFKKGHKQFNTGRTHFKKGRKIPEETKRKIWKAVLESGRAFRKDNQLAKGRKHTEKSRKLMSSIHKGEKGSNWRGGVSSEDERIRKSIETGLWRESVFARDNWTCQRCKERGGKLVAHHIQNFAQYPELRFAIDNGITFCKNCHRKFHKIYGYKDNTKEQIEEFLCYL